VRIAAIDIGSNSIRQTIADVTPNGVIRVVDEMKAAPRLGAGVAATGRLQDSALHDALDALARMALLSSQMGVTRTDVVATSAVRDADNGAEFASVVRDVTGLRVRLLDGEEEARLSFNSARAHFDLSGDRAVVMDIGGGSLELTLSAAGLIDRLVSLPLGAIRLTEEFLDAASPRKALRALRLHVRKALRLHIPRKAWHGAQIIGSGGTFTNLAGMMLARHGIPRGHGVHGTVVSRTDVEHVLDALLGLSPAERMAVPGLNPARADIIIAGLAVAAEVMARLDTRELTVSAYGIREGLLLDVAHVSPVIADRSAARERSVAQLAQRSQYDAPHAQQVQKLALQLFDALAHTLRLTTDDRQLLADAALLHDIGYHIHFDDHHKHSYHLIIHADLIGMTPAERMMVANVARYHRGAVPRKSHRGFAALDRSMRRRIRRLAAILRVADGLDRGHACAVDHLAIDVAPDRVRVCAVPIPGADLRLDVWGATRKCALLESVLSVPVNISSAEDTPEL
jgi:exopolyphosphatase/guanosine-5'-triphosphate,3'-diphosphate pyrophosphatase